MKKKLLTALLTVISVIALSACAEKEAEQAESSNGETIEAVSIANESDVNEVTTTVNDADDDADVTTMTVDDTDMDETETAMDDMVYEYPAEEHASEVQESSLGYSMTYDPTVFVLDETGESDSYTYMTAEKLDAPVYLTVQKYTDMDAQTLAEGLALQSGSDDVEVQDAFFGADSLETKLVYVEKEVEGVTQIQIFYAIPVEEGVLLVEIGSYIGGPQVVDWKIEEMLGTFTLN